ncbi:MAG: Hpt domain-containing protein [Parasphingopyxis sp.]|uniref:Hpt domain-containing protein n=1 Tax=Parasphingopyxis sp. TaxID=1920299 RepID=UPI00262E5736|nr:Hpt domain-containing protein [uncultured Parasphingopyxis sp.]
MDCTETGSLAEENTLVNWPEFEAQRAQLGAHFARILGYFQEDGIKSVELIEAAVRDRDSAALVRPAHTLKGEAAQFGATVLSELAEKIELSARHFVEAQVTPEEIVPDAAKLRPLFNKTLEQLLRETNPLVQRRRFGVKESSNQSFGRL